MVKVIGYNYYFFKKDGDKTTVTNQTKFTVNYLEQQFLKLKAMEKKNISKIN